MVDERFFTPNSPLSVENIASLVSGEIFSGDSDEVVTAVAPLHSVSKGQVSFLKEKSHLTSLNTQSEAVILTSRELAGEVEGTRAIIIVANPRAAFAKVSAALIQEKITAKDNRSAAVIDPSAIVDDTAIISAFCIIGANAVIGAGTILETGAHVAVGVSVGNNCKIGSHAHLQHCIVGSGVSIGAQTVVGKVGFGFEMTENGAVLMPHTGRVIIGDGSSIGANCTIDRGVMDDTVLDEHVMIDNLVHIAHNVRLGARSLVLAQSGIAGSTKIGSDCIIAAQVGVKDHVEIASKSVILSRSAVTKSLTKPGVYAGFPAQLSKDEWREQAQLKKLIKEKFGKG